MFSLKYICLRDFHNIKEGTIVFFLFSRLSPQEPFGIGLEENSDVCLPYHDSIKHFFMPLRSYKLNKILEKIQQNKLLD
jgi:hypothetical protein